VRPFDQSFHEPPTPSRASPSRRNEQTAHLGDAVTEVSQADAARWSSVLVRGEQHDAGSRIDRVELHQLLLNVIESNADLRLGGERRHVSLVRTEQTAHRCELSIGQDR